jgi:hypothetical protein
MRKAEVGQALAAKVCGPTVEAVAEPVCETKVAAVARSSAAAQAEEMP